MIRNNNIGKFIMATGHKIEIKKTLSGIKIFKTKRYLLSLPWNKKKNKKKNIDSMQEKIKGYPPLKHSVWYIATGSWIGISQN